MGSLHTQTPRKSKHDIVAWLARSERASADLHIEDVAGGGSYQGAEHGKAVAEQHVIQPIYSGDTVAALVRLVEARDAYTAGHQRRLAGYACTIGERVGLRGEDLITLRYGALLHDLGKIMIDPGILQKPGPLTAAEYCAMQQHPMIGERIVRKLGLAPVLAEIVRHHHERWDGRGYPDGLAGAAIPLGARIVAAADAFDAMTTQRPYNRVVSFPEAIVRLQEGAGSCWDPCIVTYFAGYLRAKFS